MMTEGKRKNMVGEGGERDRKKGREKEKGKKKRKEGERNRLEKRGRERCARDHAAGAHTQDRQPRRWQEASEEEAGDFCRHPGLPGSTETLKVPWELMASDVPCPTAPSPSSQARLEQEATPTARLLAPLSRPLQPLLFPLSSGVCRAGLGCWSG